MRTLVIALVLVVAGAAVVAAQPAERPIQLQPGGAAQPGAVQLPPAGGPIVIQPGQPGQPGQPRGQVTAAKTEVSVLKRSPHGDTIEANGKGTALLFWAFALISVGGAFFVVTRRNLIAAVMGMVGSFLGIAVVYMMLYASFLSVVQMLVYAGAIMVLFVFVVMILNRPEDEPVAPSGRIGQLIGGAAMLYLIGRLVMTLINVRAPASAMGPPQPVPGTTHEWGSVKAVGTDLFGPGLFPFEAISILLLVAVVGAIAIARPLHEDKAEEADHG